MSLPDFITSNLPVFGLAGKVIIILTVAIILNHIQKKVIPNLIISCVPKIRIETQDQLILRARTMAYVIRKVIAVVIWLIAIIMILGAFQVDTSPLLASLGVTTLALGFAAQYIIRDYLNGFFILMEDWYRIGEWVTISGLEGEVEKVSPRRTVLREINGTMHVIPNNSDSNGQQPDERLGRDKSDCLRGLQGEYQPGI
jgi:small conductance mechanosensitive channel